MLAPKRVKFRKRFKGRTKGMATRGNTVAFGHYGLMALEPGWISNRQIEASRVALTREMTRGGGGWSCGPRRVAAGDSAAPPRRAEPFGSCAPSAGGWRGSTPFCQRGRGHEGAAQGSDGGGGERQDAEARDGHADPPLRPRV